MKKWTLQNTQTKENDFIISENKREVELERLKRIRIMTRNYLDEYDFYDAREIAYELFDDQYNIALVA